MALIIGNYSSQELTGTEENDTIQGKGGWDTLYGLGGDDLLEGGNVNDYLYGGTGNDQLYGGGGDWDRLYGGTGSDTLNGEAGNDYLFGENGNDVLYGGVGNDSLSGGSGNNTLSGGDGNDTATGGEDNDLLLGELGQDVLSGFGGNDLLHGGSGQDSLYGGDGDDLLEGGSGEDYLFGGAGQDTLDGGTQNDTLYGGVGSDVFRITTDTDTSSYKTFGKDTIGDFAPEDRLDVSALGMVAPDGLMVLMTQEGANTVLRFSSSNTLTLINVQKTSLTDANFILAATTTESMVVTGEGILSGNNGNDSLTGGSWDDVLFGGGGDDRLDGRGAQSRDYLHGGAGNDTFVISQFKRVDILDFTPGDRIDLTALRIPDFAALQMFLIETNGSNGVVTGIQFNPLDTWNGVYLRSVSLASLSASDFVFQTTTEPVVASGSVILFGGGGNDVLTLYGTRTLAFGLEGDDQIILNSDTATLRGGAGVDTFVFKLNSNGADILDFEAGEKVDISALGVSDISLIQPFMTVITGGTFFDIGAFDLNIFHTSPLTAGDFVFAAPPAGPVTTPGPSNKYLFGSQYDDVLSGAALLSGGAGNDVLRYGDYMAGGAGNDTFVLSAQQASGTIYDLSSDDRLNVNDWGLTDFDTVQHLMVVSGNDLVLSGIYHSSGEYKLSVRLMNTSLSGLSPTNFIFDTSATPQNRFGQDRSEFMIGRNGNDTLDGGQGNDTLLGGGGDDILDGGNHRFSGNDSLYGGSGHDVLYGYDGNDALGGGSGHDTLYGGRGRDSLNGGDGDDRLTTVADRDTLSGENYDYLDGGAGNDTLTAAKYNDTLLGGDGDDYLDGGAGADVMNGGDGNDTIVLESVNDTATGGAGEDLILSPFAYVLEDFEHLTLTGTAAVNGTGNALANRITGNSGANLLVGGAGNDTISGGGGNDVLSGGDGQDSFLFSSGALVTDFNLAETLDLSGTGFVDLATVKGLMRMSGNTAILDFADGMRLLNIQISDLTAANFIFAAASTTPVVLTANGTVFGNMGHDSLTGGTGSDFLIGAGGDDVLSGGNGVGSKDRFYGGEGNDLFVMGELFLQAEIVDFKPGDRIDVVALGITSLGQLLVMTTQTGSDVTIDAGGGRTVVLRNVARDSLLASDFIFGKEGGTAPVIIATGPLLYGAGGDDILTLTGSGTLRAYGFDGNDRIVGSTGSGNDWMSGGNGNDTFAFGVLRGDDKIVDFATGDRIDLSLLNFTDFETVRLFATFRSDQKTDLVVGGKLVIEHAGLNTLTASDFIFATSTAPVVQTGNNNTFRLFGLAGDDVLTAGGTSWLIGGAGNDRLIGGEIMSGGSGNDTYVVGRVGNLKDLDAGDVIDVSQLDFGSFDMLQSFMSQSDANVRVRVGDISILLSNTLLSSLTADDFLFADNSSIRYRNGIDTADLLLGGGNGDFLFGKRGNDSLYGGDGNDYLDGGDPTSSGAGGADLLDGGNGDDILESKDNNDSLFGGAGNDRLDGGIGNDTMYGGTGNDTYVVDVYKDVVRDDDGNDLIESTITYALGEAIERLTLTASAAINGTGNELANALTGNAAANGLYGRGGNDTILGGLGNDSVYGDAGDDSLIGDDGADVMDGGSGHDWLMGSMGNDTMYGGDGNDSLRGAANDDLLFGGSGNDYIYGQSGNDTLNGNAGADTMQGGLNDDTYYLTSGADVVIEFAEVGTDTVFSSVNYTLGANVENLVLTGSSERKGNGNDLANSLTGNNSANTLSGGGGDDALYGSGGNDVLNGNVGNDRLIGDAGADTMYGGVGDDSYYLTSGGDLVVEVVAEGTDTVHSSVNYTLGAHVENLVLTGLSDRKGTGNDLANSLTGNSGANRLDGGMGNDTLTGGDGADTFVFLLNSGVDVITDFDASEGDTIDLSAWTGGMANNGLVTQVGGDVLITLGGGNTITVQGAATADVLAQVVW